MGIRLSTNENLLSTNLITSQLIHRQTLSTCYDAIFDLSLGEQSNFLLISDDNRLRLFEIDEHNQYQLVEKTFSLTKRLLHEQVYDIIWSNVLEQFLVLTSKRMILYDKNMDLVDLELHLDKNSPPLWRMACWSIHLIVNLGLGTSLRYYQLQTCQSVEFIKSYSRTDLGYTNSDLLSTIILSPQSILGINVELANNRHIIDLYSLNDFVRLKRVDFNDPCPLDLLTSLRDYTWLCKSHWPSDDCLCLIESDGQVSKCPSIEIDGYILNLKISIHRSFIVLIRTANKLPKEIDINELNRIDEQEQEEPTIRGRKREVIGKLPGNLLLEIYQVKKQNQSTIEELKK